MLRKNGFKRRSQVSLKSAELIRGQIPVIQADHSGFLPPDRFRGFFTFQVQIKYLSHLGRAGYKKSLSQLAVTGSDLISLGFSGRAVGNVLNTLLDAVIMDQLANKKEDLLDYAEDLLHA